MFFTRLGLEQATDQWVAAHKARRFAAAAKRGPIADFCCGIGGDLVSLAEVGTTTGIDRDGVAACFAAANACAADVVDRTSLQTHDLESIDAGDFAAWHIDPDRRPSGKRTTSLEWSSPGLDVIERLLAQSPDAADQARPGSRRARRLVRALRTRMDQPRSTVPAARRLAWRARPGTRQTHGNGAIRQWRSRPRVSSATPTRP